MHSISTHGLKTREGEGERKKGGEREKKEEKEEEERSEERKKKKVRSSSRPTFPFFVLCLQSFLGLASTFAGRSSNLDDFSKNRRSTRSLRVPPHFRPTRVSSAYVIFGGKKQIMSHKEPPPETR